MRAPNGGKHPSKTASCVAADQHDIIKLEKYSIFVRVNTGVG
jgi:hypothetical protein